MRRNRWFASLPILVLVCAALVYPSIALAAQRRHPGSELTGTWQGTSVCTDRIAAPACRDETVIYEFTAGANAETAHWKADKVVDGKRVPMGEFDLVYSSSDSCWRADLTTPRFRMVWCVMLADRSTLSGTATLLPGRQIVRRIQAHKK